LAKKWYPVIDYVTCVECGACVAMCRHGVYDAAKASSPVVKNGGECIDHCHGCGNRCPVGAITYVGEDTDWVPPNGKQTAEESGCSCGCEAPSARKVVVDYLYIDLEACDRCVGTEHVLNEVMVTLSPALSLAGLEVRCNKIEMKTAETAQRHRFLSSPTIRVNGADICQSVVENSCGCCSDISGTDVSCRVFEYGGEVYEVPPKEMLAEAILDAVFGQSQEDGSCKEYALPQNLRDFYEGKKSKQCCSCGGDCY